MHVGVILVVVVAALVTEADARIASRRERLVRGRLDIGGGIDVDLVSPRHVARMLSVSEASIKRWSNSGVLSCIRTDGCHRRFRVDDLARFLRALRPGADFSRGSTERVDRFRDAALSADIDALVVEIATARLAGETLPAVLDSTVAPVARDLWLRQDRGVLSAGTTRKAIAAIRAALQHVARFVVPVPRPGSRLLVVGLRDDRGEAAVGMTSLVAHGLGFEVSVVSVQRLGDVTPRIAASRTAALAVVAPQYMPEPPCIDIEALVGARRRPQGTVVVVGPASIAEGQGVVQVSRYERLAGWFNEVETRRGNHPKTSR